MEQLEQAIEKINSCKTDVNNSLFVLAIDDTSGHCLNGFLGQPFCKVLIPFQSLDEAILKMDYLMDKHDGGTVPPHRRSYFDLGNGRLYPRGEMMTDEKMSACLLQGLIADDDDFICRSRSSRFSFIINIGMRRNASWQGTILLMRGCRRNSLARFSSVLELMRLIWSVVLEAELPKE